jgi:uncharacterized RDD family membrane protein YckC
MFCTNCGSPNADDAQFCSRCGASQAGRVAGGVSIPSALMSAASAQPSLAREPAMPYAGFWARFLAMIIDGLLFGIVFVPVAIFMAIFTPAMRGTLPSSGDDPRAAILAVGYLFFILVSVVGGWIYFAAMESSHYQATLGKRAVGLRVTDLNGQRISFGRASGRYFGKMLSSAVFHIGYLMAAFTEKKQALHDILAKCLVVKP